MKGERQPTDVDLAIGGVVAHVVDVLEHGRPRRNELAELAHELLSARWQEQRQPRGQVGRPRLAELEHVVHLDQVEVVIGVQVRDHNAVQTVRRDVLGDAPGGPGAAVHEDRCLALPQQISGARPTWIRSRGTGAQDGQRERRHSGALC